jgi:two-component system, chemotaxis family, CheB/CheR fusion protein
LQQQLYALQLLLTFLQEETAPGPPSQTEAGVLLQEMEAAVQTAIATSRRLSVDLSPPILEGEGLADALAWLAQSMEQRHRLRLTVEAEDSFMIPDVDLRVLLFQAVRELLFNVVKHARVSEATARLQLVAEPGMVRAYRIDVIDKGVGFDLEAVLGPAVTPTGRGLLHIRQRLDLVGGRLEVASLPDDGNQVTILVPAPKEPAAGQARASTRPGLEGEE